MLIWQKLRRKIIATLGVYDYDFGGDVDAALAFLRVGIATCEDRDGGYIKVTIKREDEEQEEEKEDD